MNPSFIIKGGRNRRKEYQTWKKQTTIKMYQLKQPAQNSLVTKILKEREAREARREELSRNSFSHTGDEMDLLADRLEGIRIQKKHPLAPKLVVERFFNDLVGHLNESMSDERLGAEALIYWKESEYQSIVAGIVGVLASTTYKNHVSFYRFEQRISETYSLLELRLQYPMSQSSGGSNERRVDLLIQFKDHPIVVVELKYIPLQYARFPKNMDKFLQLRELKSVDSRNVQSLYSASLTYSEELEKKRKALSNPSATSSDVIRHIEVTRKFLKEEKNYLTFEVAPVIDLKYQANLKTILDSEKYREIDILLEVLHNAEKIKVSEFLEKAKLQCLNYGNIMNKANEESQGYQPADCRILWGLWRTSSHASC